MKSTAKTILRLLGFLKPLSAWVGLSVLTAAAMIASNIGLLGTSAGLIARAALHPSVAELGVAIVGVRFFGISRSLLRYAERLTGHSANLRLLAELRGWLFEKLEPLAPARLEDAHVGDLLSRVVADVDSLEDFYVRAVAPPLTALLVTLGMGAFLGTISTDLGTALVLGLLLSGSGVPWLARRLARAPGKKLVEQRSYLAARLVDSVQGLPDLLSCGAEGQFFDQLRIADESAGGAEVRLAGLGGLAGALNGLSSNLTLWFVLLLAIPSVHAGRIDGVLLAVAAMVTLASFEATLPLGLAAQKLEISLQSAARLFAITDAPPAVQDPPHPAPPPVECGLEIRRLTFRYAPDLPLALDGLSLELPMGKRVGLVGPSGAGKSTLFQLLQRFRSTPEGQILLDGRDLGKFSQADVRARLAVVSSDPYLFHGTVRSNLLLARPDAGEEDLSAALNQACLGDWAAGLPQGLDSWIGERGLSISGGERQRLAVARTLLQDAPLWLLDEPTAHLDPVTRQNLAGSLLESSRGHSVIWISHTPGELLAMDEILVLRDGRVVERGSPGELLAAGGWFSRWCKARIL